MRAAQTRADSYLDLINGELPVKPAGIPNFNRGPMDTAVQLRGWRSLMFDMIDQPAFVHDLMEAITEYRLDYETRRAELTGIGIEESLGGLWEDDVNCDVLSPDMYEEFVFPYEKRMASQHKQVTYHSCGNLTPVLPLINKLPNLHKIYFSEPWTDFESAKSAVRNKKIIRIDMNPPTNIGAPEESVVASLVQNGGPLPEDSATPHLRLFWLKNVFIVTNQPLITHKRLRFHITAMPTFILPNFASGSIAIV